MEGNGLAEPAGWEGFPIHYRHSMDSGQAVRELNSERTGCSC